MRIGKEPTSLRWGKDQLLFAKAENHEICDFLFDFSKISQIEKKYELPKTSKYNSVADVVYPSLCYLFLFSLSIISFYYVIIYYF